MDRERPELSRCRCIAALAACLELVPEEELDFPWPAPTPRRVPGWNRKPVADPVVDENYLTWTTDCSKLAQVGIISLHPCPSGSHVRGSHYGTRGCRHFSPLLLLIPVLVLHMMCMFGTHSMQYASRG